MNRYFFVCKLQFILQDNFRVALSYLNITGPYATLFTLVLKLINVSGVATSNTYNNHVEKRTGGVPGHIMFSYNKMKAQAKLTYLEVVDEDVAVAWCHSVVVPIANDHP